MKADQIRREVNKLEISERLGLVEALWDDIAATNGVPPLHEWQKRTLEQRYQSFQNGELSTRDWEAVHRELRARYE